MVARLIRIYTPFICALTAIIHGVLYLMQYGGTLQYYLNEMTGQSIIMVAYLLATSKRMCRWYRYTCWLLMLVHMLNLLYYIGFSKGIEINYFNILYAGLVINFISLITFLIYRLKVGITKILC